MKKNKSENIISLNQERKKRAKPHKSHKILLLPAFICLLVLTSAYFSQYSLWRVPGISYSHIISAQPAYILDKAHNFGDVVNIVPTNHQFSAFHLKKFWYEVDYNGKRGFIPINYMIQANIDSNGGNANYRGKLSCSWEMVDGIAVQKSTYKENGEEKALISAGEINLRDGGGINRDILVKIPENTQLMVLDKRQEWYRVFYAGTVGYVHKRNLLEKVIEPLVEKDKSQL